MIDGEKKNVEEKFLTCDVGFGGAGTKETRKELPPPVKYLPR